MDTSRVIVTGVHETIASLKKFDQDALKRFNKVINDELRTAKVAAQGLIPESPMRNWRTVPAKKGRTRGGAGWPAWDAGAVKAGIKTTRAQGKVRKDYTTNAGALINKTPAGVIFEVAGRSKGKSTLSDKGGSGEQFKRNLGNKYGAASRVVWRIVDRDANKIRANFIKALEQAKSDLQTAFDRSK